MSLITWSLVSFLWGCFLGLFFTVLSTICFFSWLFEVYGENSFDVTLFEDINLVSNVAFSFESMLLMSSISNNVPAFLFLGTAETYYIHDSSVCDLKIIDSLSWLKPF